MGWERFPTLFGTNGNEKTYCARARASVGVKCEYGEPVEEGEYKGTFKTVGDVEHANIIKLYIEDGLGMNKIAERLGRSSATPHDHIKQHNRAIARSGFCPPCRRVKSKFESKVAVRS